VKVAIYARESSDDTEKAPPIEHQIAIGKSWIEQHGHELTEIYQDNGFSGGNWKRPAWLKCINDAKAHRYVMLWVWKQDRIARDTEQFLFFYRNMKDAKVNVTDSDGVIDLETAGNRLKHTVISASDEMFRLITGEKVKRAYIEKKKIAGENKIKWGRPDVDKSKTWIKKYGNKTLDRNAIIKEWNDNEGVGYRQFAKKYGVSHQTIKRIIGNANEKDEITRQPANFDGFYKKLPMNPQECNKIPV
jgi:DNA invertase Pin-like site-specific DNA recombinase